MVDLAEEVEGAVADGPGHQVPTQHGHLPRQPGRLVLGHGTSLTLVLGHGQVLTLSLVMN